MDLELRIFGIEKRLKTAIVTAWNIVGGPGIQGTTGIIDNLVAGIVGVTIVIPGGAPNEIRRARREIRLHEGYYTSIGLHVCRSVGPGPGVTAKVTGQFHLVTPSDEERVVSGNDVLTDSEDRLIVFAASNISEQGTLSPGD